jgi:hypothetical protein
VQNSVRLAADQAIAGIKPSKEELTALRDAFVPHLVRLRLDDAKRVRQPARRADLPRDAERLLRALIEARLLSVRTEDHTAFQGERLGEAVVEVAHEALFEAWPALKTWLDEEQNFLADMARLKGTHETWEKASERDKPRALLHGLLLNRARDWLVKHPSRFEGRSMEPLCAFILDSATAEDAEQARTQRLRSRAQQMAALAGVLILGVGAGLAWSNQAYLSARAVMLLETIWSPVLTTPAERGLKPGDPFKECRDCPVMVVVRAGQFTMGTPKEKVRYGNESPQHPVTIARAFAVSRFEVTSGEWDACVILGGCKWPAPDTGWGRGRRPVMNVNWDDAQQYVAWLVKRTGMPYRLLSEAE